MSFEPHPASHRHAWCRKILNFPAPVTATGIYLELMIGTVQRHSEANDSYHRNIAIRFDLRPPNKDLEVSHAKNAVFERNRFWEELFHWFMPDRCMKYIAAFKFEENLFIGNSPIKTTTKFSDFSG